MKGLFVRDIKLAFVSGNNLVVSLLFFLAVIVITPFGIGPSAELLAKTGTGILWIGALLAILLGLDRLFQTEREDGALDIMIMDADLSTLAVIVLIKCLAHWTGSILPLVIVSPFLGMMLNMEPAAIGMTMLTLLLGTPAIALIGAAGAALTVALPRGGVLLSVIVLPLAIPVLIFGVSAANAVTATVLTPVTPLLFLIALTLLFAVIGPVAAAAALKYLTE